MMVKVYWRAWVGLAGGMLTVALFFLAWAFPTFPGDEWALLRFQGLQTGWLTTVAVGVSTLGQTPVAAGMVGAVFLGLALLRRWKDGGMALFVLVATAAGNALKLVVERPRQCTIYEYPFEAGRIAPRHHVGYPLRANAGLVEAAVIVGLIAVFP